MTRATWPSRSRGRHPDPSAAKVTPELVRRLPVSAAQAAPLPPPTLRPASRRDAMAATLVVGGTLALLVSFLLYSIEHLAVVGLPGRIAVLIIITLTTVTLLVYGLGLLFSILPVLFGLRRPAPRMAPRWDRAARR